MTFLNIGAEWARTGQVKTGRGMTGQNDTMTSPQGENVIYENGVSKNRDRTGQQKSSNPESQKIKKAEKTLR